MFRSLQLSRPVGGAYLNFVLATRWVGPHVAPESPHLRRVGIAENFAGAPRLPAIRRNFYSGDAHIVGYRPTGNHETGAGDFLLVPGIINYRLQLPLAGIRPAHP